MSPVYDLNQPSSCFPFEELIEDHQQLQLFLSPHHHHHAAYTSFSSSPSQDQLGSTQLIGQTTHQHDDLKVDKYMPDRRSKDHIQISSSSSLQVAIDDNMEVHKLPSLKREDENCYDRSGNRSENWMSSKMRIMQNLMHSNCSEATNKPVKFTLKFQDHQQYQANNNDISSSYSNSNNNNIIRVCSDCNTTTTPLWRSGPRGPKSLCNACGIRQRKARRAMAAAAAAGGNGTVVTMETSSTKTKIKEKKTRTSHVAQWKKLCKLPDHQPHNHGQKTKIRFKNLALSLSKNSTLQRVFPRDVEEAAILLMELSCGFIHS